jgi:hypothetical protein
LIERSHAKGIPDTIKIARDAFPIEVVKHHNEHFSHAESD